MASRKLLNLVPTALAVATALLYLTSNAYSASPGSGAVLRSPGSLLASNSAIGASLVRGMNPVRHDGGAEPRTEGSTEASTDRALDVLASGVHQLSHPAALRDAFQSYFAFASEHPEQVRKPYLYFVDYGLSSSTPRGYLFDMHALRVVDGPFMVAQGRGSSTNARGVPTHFSNSFGAATTSLGLYVAQELYKFTGHAGGEPYHSVGLRLAGVSGHFNDNARARGVVAHGAPYVTATRAGRSEGCPAMTPERARELLPKLASGGMVYLFAPDSNWMANDPWLSRG